MRVKSFLFSISCSIRIDAPLAYSENKLTIARIKYSLPLIIVACKGSCKIESIIKVKLLLRRMMAVMHDLHYFHILTLEEYPRFQVRVENDHDENHESAACSQPRAHLAESAIDFHHESFAKDVLVSHGIKKALYLSRLLDL